MKTDKKTNNESIDEFEFLDDEEFNDEEFATVTDDENIQGNLHNNKKANSSSFLKIIGIISVISIASYFSYNFLNKNKNTKDSKLAIITENVSQKQEKPELKEQNFKDIVSEFNNNTNANTILIKPTKPQDAAVVSQPTQVAENNNLNKQLQQTLENLIQEISIQINTIKQLEAAIAQLYQNIDKSNRAINAIDHRVSGLTESINNLSQDFVAIEKIINEDEFLFVEPTTMKNSKLSNNKNNKNETLTYKAPEYVVHAIIPGRAWLKSTTGQIITVAEGDVIGDYGKIAAIDVANNIVRTSSGVSFK